jgi:hypothetical protein
MADIQNDAQPRHFLDGVDAQTRQPASRIALSDSIGQHRPAIPGEGHHPHARLKHRPNERDVAPERLAPLKGEDERDSPAVDGSFDVSARQANGDVVGMLTGDLPGLVKEEKGPAECAFADVLLLDEHRKNLKNDTALA